MELREWLIILGLALVSLIVIDGARRLQRQRRVPRLDQAETNVSSSQPEDPDEAAKEAEINWELPNGGARVVKPADYSGLGNKPKLERQEHPGPSKVLAEFRRSASAKATKRKADKADKAASLAAAQAAKSQSTHSQASEQPVTSAQTATRTAAQATSSSAPTEHERREPSIGINASPSDSPVRANTVHDGSVHENKVHDNKAHADQVPASVPEAPQPALATAPEHTERAQSAPANTQPDDAMAITASQSEPETVRPAEPEPVLRAEPEDAVFAKHANEHSPKRRQLRSDTVGEHDELDDDEVDEYRLVDFEGMGRSLKRRLIERRREKQRQKAEKALRDKALAKQKAERKALEAEQRREAKEAADAERARLAQEQAQDREEAAAAAAAEQRSTAPQHADEHYHVRSSGLDSAEAHADYQYDEEYRFAEADDASYDGVPADEYGANDSVRTHPTLAKALRHDVNGENAKEALSNAEEVVVISVLSRDPEGFDGTKLLELMMVCGLRYSSAMGVFHRFETESDDSELQFSMVNVVKPGTFPIEEMGTFMTPGITLLMPLPGAVDSAAAFEAMVETAMVVVRHMGGELKDENRSVMTAQTIEFARQRVRDFERRHRLNRQLQAR